MWGRVFVLALFAVACVPAEELLVPDSPGARSIVLVVIGPSRAVSLFAFPAVEVSVPVTLGPESEVIALYYDRELESLQLSPGPIPLAGEVAGRPLPPWMRVERVWGPDDGALALLDSLRIAPFDFARCAANEGCLVDAGDDFCTLPCPEPPAPMPPMRPAAPVMGKTSTCPDGQVGFHIGDNSGNRVLCDIPVPEMMTCPVGQVQFLGDLSCTYIGTPCPTGEWPEGLPANRQIFYVRAGGGTGGTGTTADPFGTIAAALRASAPGTIIALSRGEFSEAISLPGGVTLRGACVGSAGTRLTREDVAVDVIGLEARVENLELGRGLVAVRADGPDRSVHLEDVRVVGPGGPALLATNTSSASAHRVWISDRRYALDFLTRARTGGDGLSQVIIERAVSAGLRALGVGARVVASDLIVRGTRSGDIDGRGVFAQAGGSVVIDGLLVEATIGIGVQVCDNPSSIEVRHAIVRDTSTTALGEYGWGVNACGGSRFVANELVLQNNTAYGLYASPSDNDVTLDAVTVRDQRVLPDGSLGQGMWLVEAGRVVVRDALVLRNWNAGIGAWGLTNAQLERVIVRGTMPQPVGKFGGYGIQVADRAVAVATSVILEENALSGAHAVLADFVLRDALIARTKGAEVTGMLATGYGLVVDTATLTLERALLEESKHAAIYLSPRANLIASDLVIRGVVAVHPADNSGLGVLVENAKASITRGQIFDVDRRGIHASGNASSLDAIDVDITGADGAIFVDSIGHLVINRIRADANRGFGVLVIADAFDTEVPKEIMLDDLEVTGTSLDAPCLMPCVGAGLRLRQAVHATVRRFRIAGNAELGVFAEDAAGLVLMDGRIEGHPIGIGLDSDEVDESTLVERVVYRANHSVFSRF